jgi:hypothetical protein
MFEFQNVLMRRDILSAFKNGEILDISVLLKIRSAITESSFLWKNLQELSLGQPSLKIPVSSPSHRGHPQSLGGPHFPLLSTFDVVASWICTASLQLLLHSASQQAQSNLSMLSVFK